MLKTLKFLLISQLKKSQRHPAKDGFTLVELLIALILAFLIITPLLGFMISIMNTDRQEQAKTTSEQEIQAALDYIARDLQQAVYIYDGTGVEAIKNQIPSGNDRVPVLVFWKRELIPSVISNQSAAKDDTFVYSLVAYYIIKNNSNYAKIGRWQVRDGVRSNSSSGVDCTGYTGKYISSSYCPKPGFALFNLDTAGTLEEKMNAWRKASADYSDTTAYTLVDFIDQTTTTNGAPSASCLADPNNATAVPKTPPSSFNTLDPVGKMSSFYACVYKVDRTAQRVQLFIRGNALARIENNPNKINYADSKKTYYPIASMQVQGRGYLFTR